MRNWDNKKSIYLGDHPYNTSAKWWSGKVRKMTILADS